MCACHEDEVPVRCDCCNVTVVLTLREATRLVGPFFCSDHCEDATRDPMAVMRDDIRRLTARAKAKLEQAGASEPEPPSGDSSTAAPEPSG